MYSSLRNVQILVALLKEHGVRRIVISAGTRHTPLVASVEGDSWFKTYSVVDERSASFFALGLIELTGEPAAVACTSGTAAANYVSAANEAFYQHLPLVLLTADRNPYYLFQQEEQMIPQEHLYCDVIRKSVTLPHVRDDKDAWYCARLCNEALLELNHREPGPVHINFIVENDYPITQGIIRFEEKELPQVRKIRRLTHESSGAEWRNWANKVSSSKVLIIYGQHRRLSTEAKDAFDRFCERCDCAVSTDLLANLTSDATVRTFALMWSMGKNAIEELLPDLVITMNAHTISAIKTRLAPFAGRFEHWHVSLDGEVSDVFKCLPDVVECSPERFFDRMASLMEERASFPYREAWKAAARKVGEDGSLMGERLKWSAVMATQRFMARVPEDAVVHLANSNTIRIANLFDLDPSVDVFCNRGTHGIDGSMSAYLAQSHESGRPSFLLIGDLSFFYDMNCLWTQYVGSNTRILVINNGGGAIFHTYPGTKNVPTLDEHIAAEHEASVEGWSRNRGFEYYSAHDETSLESSLDILFGDGSAPVLVEAFTDKDVDAAELAGICDRYRFGDPLLRSAASKILSAGVKDQIKKIIR
jgi:2-succinyl-5-enolpyruvyl-6-hydroxy-3-cyclohexene-1-carboxylate synthase